MFHNTLDVVDKPYILSKKIKFDEDDDSEENRDDSEQDYSSEDDYSSEESSNNQQQQEQLTIHTALPQPESKKPTKSSITDVLIDKFYYETMIEMNIKDINSSNGHLPDFKANINNVNNAKKKSLEEINEDEITSKALLLSLKKDLENEIRFAENDLSDLNEQETILLMGNSRLQSEINFNKTLAEEETSNISDLGELSKIVEMEVEKKESSEQKKIITNLENSDNDAFTNSSIAYNMLKLQYQIEDASRKLEEVNSIHNQHLMAKRRRMIEKLHLKEINQQKLNFEKRVSAETKRIEDKHNHDLQKLLEENRKLEEQEQMLESKLEFVVNEDGEQIMKTMERVMSMLKGREELPDGNYISVSRAIGYYSQLKDATEKNQFTVKLFKKFLREHKEFGFFVFDFEDFYAAAKVEGSSLQSDQLMTTSRNIEEPIPQKVILDPTENLYNNREEMPKFVEQEVPSQQRTPLLRKKSIGNNSMLTRSSNNTSNQGTNRSLNKSEGNATAQDVLKRSMGVLSKINQIKKNNK
ncbi:predicted protein [Naegleria gruberi]|uniref:Predicted protein n=1 Tax=Naegleria gruberi TaxID=5762 RepID=D2UYH0_NAEGR|nr:uncharacterized protein NAEGRDRAFT_45174 [Naegleria gruberi]EFC50474.1 predicted protein [Naegleria gruberi]|eukprot:XP_002683218.1 predicted protein [Naegleria gruberi strain NEG-M]